VRLTIELNGRRNCSRPPILTSGRVLLFMVGLPIVVIGGLLAISACRSSDPVPGISADDDNLIRVHLREIAPPPAMAMRSRDAMQVFQANIMRIGDTPVTVISLMVGSGAILSNTQSHGAHIYDRQTKTWRTTEDDGSSPDATTPDGTTNDAQPTNTDAMQVSADICASPIMWDETCGGKELYECAPL
jgi:hypothetical protein